MDKEEIIDELTELINEAVFIKNHKSNGIIPIAVNDSFLVKILTFFSDGLNLSEDDIKMIEIKKCIGHNELYNFTKVMQILQNVKEYYIKGYIKIENDEIDMEKSKLNILEDIFKNFHKMAIKLRSRHENRNTLEIEDEYDVQDLLYAILQLFFEDIRKEESTPSCAGSSSRVDFLLKKEKIVIETKKTRKGLKDKDISEQLMIDAKRYKSHPDCEKLICFVYDPEGRIGNPRGVIDDLENNEVNFLKVYIFPN